VVAAGSGVAGLTLEAAVRQVAPGRLDAYEVLLRALAEGSVWMLLWRGEPGSPEAQYGTLRLGELGYAPCASSAEQLAASGWPRGHEVVQGREIATVLYRNRWGLWLDPHAPGGGVGVPWADLRRVAFGLDRLPAGPLEISHPLIAAEPFYALLAEQARRLPVLRGLRRAWVSPSLGRPYLAIGLDLHDTAPEAVAAVRDLMHRCVAAAPPPCDVAMVSVADAYDPVALWLAARAQPFWTAGA
jgi:hypothetical protein